MNKQKSDSPYIHMRIALDFKRKCMEAARKDGFESLTAWIMELARNELERRKWLSVALSKPKTDHEEKP